MRRAEFYVWCFIIGCPRNYDEIDVECPGKYDEIDASKSREYDDVMLLGF